MQKSYKNYSKNYELVGKLIEELKLSFYFPIQTKAD